MKISRFSLYTIFVLLWNLLVILWGAYVRATGSGAGCGSHWPLCNGVVIPRSPQIETIVEFTHRITSALAFLLVLIMILWAYRTFPKGHPTRLGTALSMVFIITEALVGAGLVLFEWVAENISTGRVISISVHLVNTFLLLTALALTVWWSFSPTKLSFNTKSFTFWLVLLTYGALFLLGISGAITALGDTVFPTDSLLEGMRQDFDPASHFILRLRVWHPVIAILTGSIVLFLGLFLIFTESNKSIKILSWIFLGIFLAQLFLGLINVLLLAPVGIQLVHLLLADAILIVLVYLGCSLGTFGKDRVDSQFMTPRV